MFFFFKQKTAFEMRISDWSSDVCSSDLIDQVLVPGGIVSEVDFFHYPSRTLVLTDLIENIEPRRVKNILYRWLIRLGGAADPDGKAPRDMQWSFRKHRAEVHRAAERMIGWAPERILLAHGQIGRANV